MRIYLWTFPLLLALSKADNPPFDSALKAVFSVGVKLQALLDDDTSNSNFLISPISITSLIGQLMIGAEGEFRDNLFQLLSLDKTDIQKESSLNLYSEKKNGSLRLPYSKFHLEMYSLIKHLQRGYKGNNELFTLEQSNAIFYDQKLKLTQEFRHYSKLFYNSQLTGLDFVGAPREAQKTLNEWTALHTQGLIKTIFPAPPPAYTSAIFLNAIYFLAEWEIPFSDELNRVGNFNVNENVTVNATYMLGTIEQIPYIETDEYKMIALPYKNDELEMFIMLPSKDSEYSYDIRKFAQSLNATDILSSIERSKKKDVIVKIPKMTLSTSVSVLQPLLKYQASKMKAVENNTVTKEIYPDIILSGAVEDGNLRVNDIVQEMVFSINEKGTEAAAVAIGTVDYIGGQKRFLADRPFVFFIRHKSTTATLFWGTIADPS
ncbi:unnamed protein product [Brassicogethes aeneus]|uniref:Serpin domain-containing protein n=1 Tax=Brassicogethes aeneus TaxID=1431903 RepID=A0A9P0B2A9_BRAAE|nr:unnamed protein product [Brassicogethes aeneus]